jgi:chemotaxis protein MotB
MELRRFFAHMLVGILLLGLAACGSSGSVEKLRKENEQLRQKLEQAREEAASPQRGETVMVLSADVYFKSGSADLTQKGVAELKSVAQRIQQEFSDRTIRIEGYTDSRPIGAQLEDKYPSNWELSAARAARVARHFRWTHDMDPDRFEVVGFGAQHPVATNETAEGRRKNRRVRVAVLRRPPSVGDGE